MAGVVVDVDLTIAADWPRFEMRSNAGDHRRCYWDHFLCGADVYRGDLPGPPARRAGDLESADDHGGHLPALVLLVGMFFLPETPRWLMSKGRQEEGELGQEADGTLNTFFPAEAKVSTGESLPLVASAESLTNKTNGNGYMISSSRGLGAFFFRDVPVDCCISFDV
jgi:hypothetical protein